GQGAGAVRIACLFGGSARVILVFDVGNTELTIGLFNGDQLRAHWRVVTDTSRTADEFGVLLRALLEAKGFPLSQVDGAAIGSVVPRVTHPLATACAEYLDIRQPIVVDARSPLPIRLDVDEPLTVGADRLINTLAATDR